jgi:hypothetical protein
MFLKLLITVSLIALTFLWWQRRARLSMQMPSGGELSLKQAYAILGLSAQCQRVDIVQSHRRLMARVHPDKGGSNYLAAQLNAAKQRLLAVHPD